MKRSTDESLYKKLLVYGRKKISESSRNLPWTPNLSMDRVTTTPRDCLSSGEDSKAGSADRQTIDTTMICRPNHCITSAVLSPSTPSKTEQEEWQRRKSRDESESKFKLSFTGFASPNTSRVFSNNPVSIQSSNRTFQENKNCCSTDERSCQNYVCSDPALPSDVTDADKHPSSSVNIHSHNPRFQHEFNEFRFLGEIISRLAVKDLQAEPPSNSRCKAPSFDNATMPLDSLLRSVEKDVLFNEMAYCKELAVLTEVLDSCDLELEIVTSLRSIRELCRETVMRLETIVQKGSAQNDLYSYLQHYHRQLNPPLKLYKECVERLLFFCHSYDSDSVASVMLSRIVASVQTQCSGTEHTHNTTRLISAPVLHHRRLLHYLMLFSQFSSDPPYSHNSYGGTYSDSILDFSNRCLLHQLELGLEGLPLSHLDASSHLPHCLLPFRIGWLQKLTSKGASKRIFILLSSSLISVKKSQSQMFVISKLWSLADYRVSVDVISKATVTGPLINGLCQHSSNSHSPLGVLLESAFQLTLTSTVAHDDGAPTDGGELLLLADSQSSCRLWVENITKAASQQTADCSGNSSNQKDGNNIIRSNHNISVREPCPLLDLCMRDRISVSWSQARFLFEFSLAGYLLRKCSSGRGAWQRLWVQLSGAGRQLLFYSCHDDLRPAAVLSLAGSRLCAGESGSTEFSSSYSSCCWILHLHRASQDHSRSVLLRAENQYFFSRWREALLYCTSMG